jgi:hypothetical protein
VTSLSVLSWVAECVALLGLTPRVVKAGGALHVGVERGLVIVMIIGRQAVEDGGRGRSAA